MKYKHFYLLTKRETPNLEELKEIRGNNPLLLSLCLSRDITIAEFRAKVKKFVRYYISSTFKPLQTYVNMKFDDGFSLTLYFLNCAVNNCKIPKEFWVNFLNSLVYVLHSQR